MLNLSFILRGGLKNSMMSHAITKVMSERVAQGFSSSGRIFGGSSSAFMSQKAAEISVDDPAIQRYVADFLQRHENENKMGSEWHTLNKLVEQRNLVLKNLASLKELEQGNCLCYNSAACINLESHLQLPLISLNSYTDEKCEELKALAEEENEAFHHELEDIDSQVKFFLFYLER